MNLPSLPLAHGLDAPPCETEPCSQCCHDIEMLLTEADVQRIWDAAESLGIDEWHMLADDGYLQLITRDGPPAEGSPGGKPCVFLGDDGLCRIWEARPEGCRLYPAVYDDGLRAATLDADYCPHTEGFRLTGQMDAATRRLVERLQAERKARFTPKPS